MGYRYWNVHHWAFSCDAPGCKATVHIEGEFKLPDGWRNEYGTVTCPKHKIEFKENRKEG